MTSPFGWLASGEPDPDVPRALEELAALYEIRGELPRADRFRAFASELLGLSPAQRDERLRQFRRDGSPKSASGLPRDVAEAVRQLFRHGAERSLAQARARIPRDLARLLEHSEITIDDVITLHRRFGVVTAADVANAITLTGRRPSDADDVELARRLRALLPHLRSGQQRIPLGRAWSVATEVAGSIRDHVEPVVRVELLGSLRRFEPTVGDLDLLVTTTSPAVVLPALLDVVEASDVRHRGRTVASLVVHDEEVTVRAVTPDAEAAALVCLTGSARHVRELQARARQRQMTLGPTGLFRAGSRQRVACADERALYASLDLPFIAPELRHGTDEIDRATRGELPPLLTMEDVRGDFHTHTLWSDGRDSIEAMVFAARALGYQFVGITDHSARAAASRVVTRERLERQMDDIEKLREKVDDITILHGCEVDIMPDGSLDFPDEVLSRLDVVLASLHDAAGQDPDRLLERYVSAMASPFVHIVTHPANRMPGRHDGYRLDYDVLFSEAARSGTALEVDGGPGHLDLDGHLAKRAVAAGVVLAVDSDCHNAARLARQMAFAVGTARRGGVRPTDVLNTRPLDEILAFFRAKRGER